MGVRGCGSEFPWAWGQSHMAVSLGSARASNILLRPPTLLMSTDMLQVVKLWKACLPANPYLSTLWCCFVLECPSSSAASVMAVSAALS